MKTMTDEMQAMDKNHMMTGPRKRRILLATGAVVILGVGWALFRPELLFVNETVNEALPTALASDTVPASMTLAIGMFHAGAHETKGTATVHQLAGGQRVLRLTGFETSNGPDVHVYLVAANDAKDDATVKSAGFVDLGSLKGNVGDQNYDLPADLDLNTYRAATIWCARFGVNFGTAPLSPTDGIVSTQEPVALAAGAFHDGAHQTRGKAQVLRLADSSRILRLTDFETSNGPDVHVYLVAADDAKDDATVKSAGFVDLGSLKGNVGDQNYELPADLDLTRYRAATIWCARFGVNFGTAPLQ